MVVHEIRKKEDAVVGMGHEGREKEKNIVNLVFLVVVIHPLF